VVRSRFCRVIYYFDTPALRIRHQSFDRITYTPANNLQTHNHHDSNTVQLPLPLTSSQSISFRDLPLNLIPTRIAFAPLCFISTGTAPNTSTQPSTGACASALHHQQMHRLLLQTLIPWSPDQRIISVSHNDMMMTAFGILYWSRNSTSNIGANLLHQGLKVSLLERCHE